MRHVIGATVACVALMAGLVAEAQVAPKPEVLNRVVKMTRVDGKSLPETARLLEAASGVPVRLAPDLQQCITEGRPGCDWEVHTEWGGQPLESALETLCGSTKLAYRVVGNKTILITRRQSSK